MLEILLRQALFNVHDVCEHVWCVLLGTIILPTARQCLREGLTYDWITSNSYCPFGRVKGPCYVILASVDDRANVAEEEARLNELRARARAGKERQARISERTLQEWQRTMDGRKIPIPQPKKRRRKKLRKHNELASDKGSVASYFSVVLGALVGGGANGTHPPTARQGSGS